MKIGTVTFHSSHNYGSVLQAYALSRTLQNMGHETEIIDYRHPDTTAFYERKFWIKGRLLSKLKNILIYYIFNIGLKREKAFNKFIKEVLSLSKPYMHWSDIDDSYDVLIAGSDQIWNPLSTGRNAPFYFLDFGDSRIVRVSYAASCGSTSFIDYKNKEYYKKIFSSFNLIGVREDFISNHLYEKTGTLSIVNPDPTLLLKSNDWETIEEPMPNIPEKYVLLYTINKPQIMLDFAKQVAQRLNLPLVFINPTRNLATYYTSIPDYNINYASPGNFLWLYRNASFVVTNTFHGNMFSIIYRKDFVHFLTNRTDNRIITLHRTLGLKESRMISSIEQFKTIDKEIDYSKIECNIERYKNEGLDFLKRSLIRVN